MISLAEHSSSIFLFVLVSYSFVPLHCPKNVFCSGSMFSIFYCFQKVDLLATLRVEGIIVWNWSEMLMVHDQTASIERVYLLGTNHFVIYFGDDPSNLSRYEVVSKTI